MAGLFDFLSKNYNASPLEEAKKKVRNDQEMHRVLEVLEANPSATSDEVAAVLGYRTDTNGVVTAGRKVTPTIVGARHIPYAKQLLKEAHEAQTLAVVPPQPPQPASGQQSQTGPLVINIPAHGDAPVVGNDAITIDDIEAETIKLVMNAGNTKTVEKRLRRATISAFKTFGPFGVLALTIPETVWVFTHIYVTAELTLVLMTWVFSVVLDFGFLAITNLLAENKENINKKQIRGQVIEKHERQTTNKQTAAWWVVAVLDSGSQLIFLLVATWGSKMFPPWLTIGLSCWARPRSRYRHVGGLVRRCGIDDQSGRSSERTFGDGSWH